MDALQKHSLYRRNQDLEKIMDDYDKATAIMKERTELQVKGRGGFCLDQL